MEEFLQEDQIALLPEETRILASLIEKSLATPQQYPLTLNALVLACNQSTNRDPVVSYTDELVEKVLQGMKEKGLVRFVYPSHGRSATRYRHVADERFGLDTPELALIAVLMLRGPQTAGELRARTERLHRFESISDTDRILETISDRQDRLVYKLPRRPGTKEERWAFYSDGHSGSQSPMYQSSMYSARLTAMDGAGGGHGVEGSVGVDGAGGGGGVEDTGGGSGVAGTGGGHGAESSVGMDGADDVRGATGTESRPKEQAAAILEQLVAQVASLRHDLDEVRSALGLI